MIRIGKDQVVIEIETSFPESEIEEIAKALTALLIGIDDGMLVKEEISTISLLLESLYPSYEQLRKIREDAV